jgi:hypothetical protein
MQCPNHQPHASHATSSRRATCAARAVLLVLSLALAGCTDLGLPSEPAYYIADASAGDCGASRVSQGATREERRVERVHCGGGSRGSPQPAAKK